MEKSPVRSEMLGTENWHRKPMRGFNFVPIRSDAYFPEWKSVLPGINEKNGLANTFKVVIQGTAFGQS